MNDDQPVDRSLPRQPLQREVAPPDAIDFRAVLNASPESILLFNPQWRILFASQRAAQMLRYADAGELVSLGAEETVAPEDRHRLWENLAGLCRSGERRDTEYIGYRKDGSTFPMEASSAVLRDAGGELSGFVVVLRDITRRKQTQDLLRQSHQQLQAIYDTMPEGLVIADVQSKLPLLVNASICRMLGYSEAELLRLSIAEIHPPETLSDELQRFQAAAEGLCSINENRPVLRKDGTLFYADISGRALQYNGRTCLLALFRDVSERKRTQESLERERRTLHHLLQASDHERQLIAYEIHDGLAQQLTAAIMQFQAYEHLRDQPEKARKVFDAGTEMLRLAHAEARRLISGVRPPALDEAGAETAIAHLVHDRRGFETAEIEFQSDVQFDRLPAVLENALYRIAQESLSNACRHSRSEKVQVRLMQEGAHVRLEVQDWGIGFDPQAVGDGHFGLEGIRERARLLDGQFTIESRPGEGTCLTVVLPLVGPLRNNGLYCASDK